MCAQIDALTSSFHEKHSWYIYIFIFLMPFRSKEFGWNKNLYFWYEENYLIFFILHFLSVITYCKKDNLERVSINISKPKFGHLKGCILVLAVL